MNKLNVSHGIAWNYWQRQLNYSSNNNKKTIGTKGLILNGKYGKYRRKRTR